MNVGLPHGFVRFGSISHTILKLALEEGTVNQSDLSIRLNRPDIISVVLRRLVTHKFLYEVGRTKLDHVNKSCKVYSLNPRVKVAYAPPTESERAAKWRHNKKHRVASVFDWRGSI